MMESTMGRIPFYITLDDYDKLKLGQVIEVAFKPNMFIQMKIIPQAALWSDEVTPKELKLMLIKAKQQELEDLFTWIPPSAWS